MHVRRLIHSISKKVRREPVAQQIEGEDSEDMRRAEDAVRMYAAGIVAKSRRANRARVCSHSGVLGEQELEDNPSNVHQSSTETIHLVQPRPIKINNVSVEVLERSLPPNLALSIPATEPSHGEASYHDDRTADPGSGLSLDETPVELVAKLAVRVGNCQQDGHKVLALETEDRRIQRPTDLPINSPTRAKSNVDHRQQPS